jgi:transcriptional regulator with XRE-family HTH domain
MAAAPKPVGIIGGRVAANLRHLRRGTSTYELAKRLAEIGWPISANGLSRIENGQRRTDVDDLVAIAAGLGVSPNQLMFPAMYSRPGVTYALPVVGDLTAQDTDIWAWAAGDSPLVTTEDGVRGEEPSRQERVAFAVANHPHLLAVTRTERADEIVEALAGGLRLALERGASVDEVRKILDRAISEADGEPST